MLDGQNGDEDTRQKKRMMQTYMTLFNVTNSSQQLGAFLLESVVQIMMMTLNTVQCMGVFGIKIKVNLYLALQRSTLLMRSFK